MILFLIQKQKSLKKVRVMTKSKSVKILNKDNYTFRLELDDIKGIIRLTKNNSTKDTTRITDRNKNNFGGETHGKYRDGKRRK